MEASESGTNQLQIRLVHFAPPLIDPIRFSLPSCFFSSSNPPPLRLACRQPFAYRLSFFVVIAISWVFNPYQSSVFNAPPRLSPSRHLCYHGRRPTSRFFQRNHPSWYAAAVWPTQINPFLISLLSVRSPEETERRARQSTPREEPTRQRPGLGGGQESAKCDTRQFGQSDRCSQGNAGPPNPYDRNLKGDELKTVRSLTSPIVRPLAPCLRSFETQEAHPDRVGPRTQRIVESQTQQ